MRQCGQGGREAGKCGKEKARALGLPNRYRQAGTVEGLQRVEIDRSFYGKRFCRPAPFPNCT
jgi:hypothetical protein